MKNIRLWIAAAVLSVLALWLSIRLRPLLGLLLWSVVLAYLLLPLTLRWERLLPRSAAAAASLGTVLLIGSGLAIIAVPALLQQGKELAGQLPGMVGWLLGTVKNTENWFRSQLGFSETVASGWPQGAADTLFAWLGSLQLPDVGSVSHILLVPLMSGYLLADREAILCALQYLIPVRMRAEVAAVMDRIHCGLYGYIRGQLKVAVFVGGLTSIGLYAVRIPYALILGLAMTVCNVIPYFGPLLGTVPIALVAAAAGGRHLLAALAVVIAVQQTENLFISPRVMGSSLKMKPLPVLISVLAGGMLAGMTGMLLALPAVIVLREWMGYFMDRMTLTGIKVTD